MKTILMQFDTDPLPSSFDRVVAVDAGVEQLFSWGGVTPDNVTPLVHGAIFTRGPSDLKHTAVFVGGSSVAAGEELTRAVTDAFFGPMTVSVMMDSNGCNTTAAAAVAGLHRAVSLQGATAAVLGGTGPVGQRAAELLALEGARVTLISRSEAKAAAAAETIAARVEGSTVTPRAAAAADDVFAACDGHDVIVAAGAAGVCFLGEGALSRLSGLKAAVDLNAVPPLGIADIGATDKARELNGVVCYGALGAGGLKMKVQKRAVASLFEANDRVLQTRELYDLALQISGSP